MNQNLIIEKILNEVDRLDIISLGDSHSRFFSNLDKIKIYHIGPATAYNIDQEFSTNNTKNKIIDILNKTNPDKTAIILSFGEIDVRVHVIKQSLVKHISIEESVLLVLKKYVGLIKHLIDSGYKVFVNGLHGAGDNYDQTFPNVGSMKHRNFATLIFNHYLEEYCDLNKIPFASLSDMVIDQKTYKTNLEYIDDGCHLNITPELQKIIFSRFLLKLKKFKIVVTPKSG